ncbi:hypothetical protein ACIBKY_54205 [Nonomuraea sp. NPDC050394]|uniref:hypothetical protein n=1 Tax=Nonomuraea sp. NPDC050394 TaxID=3364363 RepID=UPI003791770D
MRRLKEAILEFTFWMILGLVGMGIIFGVSAVFDLPWLPDVLSGWPFAAIGLLGIAVPTVIVVWVLKKVGKGSASAD